MILWKKLDNGLGSSIARKKWSPALWRCCEGLKLWHGDQTQCIESRHDVYWKTLDHKANQCPIVWWAYKIETYRTATWYSVVLHQIWQVFLSMGLVVGCWYSASNIFDPMQDLCIRENAYLSCSNCSGADLFMVKYECSIYPRLGNTIMFPLVF